MSRRRATSRLIRGAILARDARFRSLPISAPPRLRVSRSDAHRDAEHAEGWRTRRLLSMAGATLPNQTNLCENCYNSQSPLAPRQGRIPVYILNLHEPPKGYVKAHPRRNSCAGLEMLRRLRLHCFQPHRNRFAAWRRLTLIRAGRVCSIAQRSSRV
jgi:hypothetical protein